MECIDSSRIQRCWGNEFLKVSLRWFVFLEGLEWNFCWLDWMMLHQSDVGAKGFQKGWKYRVDALKKPLRHNNAILILQSDKFHIAKNKSHKRIDSTLSPQRVYFYFLHRKDSVCFFPWKMCRVASFGAPEKPRCVWFHLNWDASRCKILRPRKHLKKKGGITVWGWWALAGFRGHFKWPIWEGSNLMEIYG